MDQINPVGVVGAREGEAAADTQVENKQRDSAARNLPSLKPAVKIHTWVGILAAVILSIGVVIVGLGVFANYASSVVAQKIQLLAVNRSSDTQSIFRASTALGFDGFIHSLKNFLLRREPSQLREAESNLTTAITVIEDFRRKVDSRQKSSVELDHVVVAGYLDGIAMVLDNYRKMIPTARALARQNKTAVEIDRAIKVDDQPAFEGFHALSERFGGHSTDGVRLANRQLLLADAVRSLGYGGLIHHFKNFVLRQSSDYAASARTSIADFKTVLVEYRKLVLNQRETDALAALDEIVTSYGTALRTAERLVAEGRGPEEIDRLVRIDDDPAVAALVILENQLGYALDSATGEIEVTLIKLKKLMTYATWTAPVLVLFLILAIIWVVRSQIVSPLMVVRGYMARLAAEDFDFDVPGADRDNEFGEMARALLNLKRRGRQRVAAQEALREQEERFRMIVDTASSGIVTIDAGGIIQFFNGGAEKMFGYEAAEIIGQNVKMLMPEPDRSQHDQYIRNYVETGKAKIIGVGREVEGIRRTGERFPIQLTIAEATLSRGQIFAAVVNELTEQKRAERELREANEELESFAYSVSHDLRAPLRAMSGFSRALIEDFGDQVDDAARDYLDRIQTASAKMGQLIEDILKLSRVSRATLEFEPVDLTGLVNEAVEDLRAAEPDRSVSVTIGHEIVARGDRHLLRVALENLLGNAWKFTSKTTAPEIEFDCVTQENGTKAFFVRDNGSGFDMRYADKLFRPFERLHSSNDYAGTGIGLATVSRVLARHGGKIWVESEIDRGTTFYFTL